MLATFYDTLVLPYLPFLKPSTKSFDLSKIEANTFVNGSYVKDAGDIAMNKMKPTIDVYQNGKASELYHGSQTKVAPAEDIGSNGNIGKETLHVTLFGLFGLIHYSAFRQRRPCSTK